jgi:chromate transporter
MAPSPQTSDVLDRDPHAGRPTRFNHGVAPGKTHGTARDRPPSRGLEEQLAKRDLSTAHAAGNSAGGARGAADAGAIPFREALRTWVRVGLLSFGGPAGQIAVMHRILVEEKRWVSERNFLHALNYCMLLPGPEAQQLATYIGWLLHRVRGGLAAGILFVVPGFVSILALSVMYAVYRETTFVQALFFGLKPAVVAIVVQAVLRIAGRALGSRALVGVAAAAFVALFFFTVPFPLVVLAAGIVGYVGSRVSPARFLASGATAAAGDVGAAGPGAAADGAEASHATPVTPSVARSVRTAAVLLVVWWAPVAVLVLVTGTGSIWVQEGVFFSQAAVVTFGGAYAVLAYIAQQAVETHGWLLPGEMLDGLGMAETTPGPLIQVVQFVGFMGAYRNPGGLDPILAGVLGSVLTTWVTFVPCFLFIFVGAPWIEHLRGRRGLSAALSGITAAVVGVILSLALWFAVHVLFDVVGERRAGGMRLLVPEWGTLDVAALVITAGAFVALFVLRWGIARTLLAAAAAGLGYGWLA